MSINIANFSLEYDQWMFTTDISTLSVDVIDPSYTISVSGTKFYYNDQIVGCVFTPITDGYRLSYNPGSISGSIDVFIHAENNNGDIKEETYNMLFGYRVVYNDPVNWGPNKQIDVWMKARNQAFCPNEETESFYFNTLDYPATNLTAKIYPVEPQDLPAIIYPQNSFFFYGRTYTITVSGIKDYHGNEMPPYIYSFTIRDDSN